MALVRWYLQRWLAAAVQRTCLLKMLTRYSHRIHVVNYRVLLYNLNHGMHLWRLFDQSRKKRLIRQKRGTRLMIHIFGNLGWQKARVRFQLWADCVPSICARRTGRQKFKSSIKKLRHLKTAALKCSKPAVSHEGQAPKATAPVVTKARIPLSVKLDEGHKPMVSGPAVEAVDTGTGQRSNASIYVDITGTSGIHPERFGVSRGEFQLEIKRGQRSPDGRSIVKVVGVGKFDLSVAIDFENGKPDVRK